MLAPYSKFVKSENIKFLCERARGNWYIFSISENQQLSVTLK
ncbi:hypothetical protein MICAD_2510011 [Microcystis aeruginosa PCC 7941]|nr:hypothetical protein MICAD_2510011 [Microcystis aeruginosa PCC 7941]